MHIYEKSRVKAMQDMLGKKMIHARFEYTDGIKRLVRSALLPLLLSRSADESLSILDCGCGVGPWLEFIAGLAPACHQDRLYGFDLTPELVELARQRLADCRLTTLISQGDILNPESYRFSDGRTSYDIIFTFNVIQQLPRKLQPIAFRRMLEHLSPKGVAVVVDNDPASFFGLRMAIKKWITRYFYIPLVPRPYLVARYPWFGKMIRAAKKHGKWCQIVSQSDTTMKALIIHPS
ncbi:MAG TPA: class I SAM-dependent methyltransferase [Kiritimatiellia bacterium]|jgi:SAM-dependent methyltransferase|nr:class I SAM-dependent methyltransferase [Kiritimatiellia bacterium]